MVQHDGKLWFPVGGENGLVVLSDGSLRANKVQHQSLK